jgi:Epoxide hydrolase N terminus
LLIDRVCLQQVVDYWLTKYDWKKQEALINKYDHFKTVIEGLNIHFVRVRPEKPEKGQQTLRVVPIILYKLIPLLTKPQQITGKDFVAFEVIIPSMPGLFY